MFVSSLYSDVCIQLVDILKSGVETDDPDMRESDASDFDPDSDWGDDDL